MYEGVRQTGYVSGSHQLQTWELRLRVTGNMWRYHKDPDRTSIGVELGRKIMKCFGNKHILEYSRERNVCMCTLNVRWMV